MGIDIEGSFNIIFILNTNIVLKYYNSSINYNILMKI